MKENASTKAAYFKQGATCQALFKINVFQISSKSPSTLAPSRILANAHRRLPSVGRPPETSHTLGLRGRAPRISRLTSAGRAKQRLQRRRSADTFLLSQMRHFRFARLPMSPRRLVRLTTGASAAAARCRGLCHKCPDADGCTRGLDGAPVSTIADLNVGAGPGRSKAIRDARGTVPTDAHVADARRELTSVPHCPEPDGHAPQPARWLVTGTMPTGTMTVRARPFEEALRWSTRQ